MPESFLKINLQVSACDFIKKETPVQVNFTKIVRTAFSYRTPTVAATEILLVTVRRINIEYQQK